MRFMASGSAGGSSKSALGFLPRYYRALGSGVVDVVHLALLLFPEAS